MKTGVFGGSFDPVHNGHLEVASACLQQLGLDQVLFVPNSKNPLRSQAKASPKDRFDMVLAALEGTTGFAASDIELSRGGSSFMVDTLTELQVAMPGKFWVIMGADTLLGIESWRDWPKLIRLARLAVVERQGTDIDNVLGRIPEDVVEAVDLVEARQSAVSSTRVRKEISQGMDVGRWVPGKVLEIIQERGLYKG